MTAFTKGQWNFTETPVSLGKGEERSYWYLVGSPERAVGFIRHKEDARLIAAAPDMYGLLKAVGFGSCDDCMPMMDAARKLIARIDEGTDNLKQNSL